MTKTIRTSLVCLCAAFVSLTAAPAAEASANLLDPIRIWGPVTSTSTEGEDARFSLWIISPASPIRESSGSRSPRSTPVFSMPSPDSPVLLKTSGRGRLLMSISVRP